MKTLIFLLILLCVITLPALAALTPEDLDKIRLIVKEEVKTEVAPIKQDIKTLDTRLQKVEQNVARLDGRLDGIEKRFNTVENQIAHGNNLTYALIALIIFAIGLPTWQNARKEKQRIEALTRRVEVLENR